MLVERAQDAIFIKDLDGRYVFINPAGAAFLDRQVSDVLGKTDRDIFSAATAAEIWAIDQQVMATGRPFTHQPTRLDFSSPRTFFTTKYPYLDEHGVLAGVMGVSHDVTEWMQAQGEAIAAQRRAVELKARLVQSERLATLGTLAAGIAHEINNPLAALLHHLDRIPDDGAQADAVRRARSGAKRIAHVVAELAPLQQAQQEHLAGSCSVVEVIDQVVGLLGYEVRHRAELDVQVEPDLPSVEIPPSRLHQVLVNLVLNAVHAVASAPPGSHRVTLRARRTEAGVELCVMDTGLGIPPDTRERVFEPFVTTKRVGQGTGLGLWVCRDVVRSHGGTIEVVDDGPGACIQVVLPAAECAEPPPAEVDPQLPSLGRVLVVDDEPEMHTVLRAGLESLTSASVVCVGGGRQALERLQGERFDAVVCDLMMPDVDGAAVHAAMVRQGLGRRMVVMTGGAFSPSARAFVAAFDGPILRKPFRIRDLAAALAGLQTS